MTDPLNRERLREQLRRDEGVNLKGGRHMPYRCTSGKLTLGYGRNIEDRGVSERTASQMLDEDIDLSVLEVVATWPWFEALSPPRQAVLVNMHFNLGLARLKKFKTTLARMEKGDHDGAAISMLESVWAEQVGDRALRLAEQWRTDRWVV